MHGTAPVPHKEIEIKLEVAPANLPDLKKIPFLRTVKPTPKSGTQVSVYFDTDKQKLRKRGLMLRVRREGRRFRQTIKATAHYGDFERDEWEAEIAGNEPDLNEANGTALEPLLTKKLRRGLKPVFETRVRRMLYPLVDNTHAIALTVDQGTIDTGTRSQPLCEIELELKPGSAVDLFDVARELTQKLPARLAVKSKSERGYEILDDEQEQPVKAISIDLQAGGGAREAFKAIGLACLKQVINNEPALLRGDPEGVHQMRVGLRRLRAAMSLFAVLLRDPQTAAIKNALKWLAGELGPARELEVLLNRAMPHCRARKRPCSRRAFARLRWTWRCGSKPAYGRSRRTTSSATAAIYRSRRSRSSNWCGAGARCARKAVYWQSSMRAAATSSASRPRSCVMRRNSSPRCSRPSGRANGASNFFPRSNVFRMGSATSTTSPCMKSASRQWVCTGGDQIRAASLPPGCLPGARTRAWPRQ